MSIISEYGENVKEIKNINFGIMSPEKVRGQSYCEIFKAFNNSSIKDYTGTLKDPRLGPIERGLLCPVCAYDYKNCVGHFGHHELPVPILHGQFIKEILTILKCICLRCSSLLVKKNNLLKRGILSILKTLKSSDKCPNCDADRPSKIVENKDKFGIISVHYTGIGMIDIKSDQILQIMSQITDDDIYSMGFDRKYFHPAWLIITVFPIPPLAMRPSVRQDNGKEADDDLTHKLNEILKTSEIVRNYLEDAKQNIHVERYVIKLTYDIWTYFNNSSRKVPASLQRSGKSLKTLQDRLKSKYGRIRNNLMGKRVDGSARSVITADPRLSLDELGVPLEIAMNLTYPEIVTNFNLSRLTQLIQNGPYKYPGAKAIKKKFDRYKKNLAFFKETEKISLDVGDIVYRHLLDNDWVLFNRQPSLHKMSMMGHRVKVLPGKTFRLNVNVTSPYNADFDKQLCQKQEA